MADPEPVVALFGHRLAGAEPTGVGRHVAELVHALATVADPGRHGPGGCREASNISPFPGPVARSPSLGP